MSDTRSKIYRPLCGSVYRPLYQCGGGSGGLCKDFLEAQYNSAISADGLSYKDKYGEDREYHKAGSIKPDTTVFFDGDIQEFDVITCEGTAVPEVDNGYFYFSTAGSAWDIKITRAGTLIAWYPCVVGSGSVLANVLSDDGSGSVTAVNATADLWQEHTDGGGSNYLNLYGFNVDGTKKQPASQANSQRDWLGNPLTHQGVVGTPLEIVKAPVFVGDGTAYGLAPGFNITEFSAITIIVHFNKSTNSSTSEFLFAVEHHTDEQIRVEFNFAGDITGIVDDGSHKYKVSSIGTSLIANRIALVFTGSTLIFYVDNVLVGSIPAVFDFSTASGLVSLASNATGSLIVDDIDIFCMAIYDKALTQAEVSVNPIEDSVFCASMTEGIPTNPSNIIYDRSGNGRHLDLLNSSADNWDLKERESYPLVDGFTFNGANLIPALLTDATKDATGAGIQYTDKQTMNADNPTVVSLAPSQPVIESENASGNRLFTDGSGNMEELTFSDFSANFHDTVFYKSPDKLAVYTQPITGDCLEKTKKYFGIIVAVVHTAFTSGFTNGFK